MVVQLTTPAALGHTMMSLFEMSTVAAVTMRSAAKYPRQSTILVAAF